MERTRAVIEEGMLSGLHIGAQVYASLNKEVCADFGMGKAAPEAPMTSGTTMLWMSAGKPLTAVAIARLWEEGLLKLDDTVQHFIPEFGSNGKGSVTIRHILTHTGGFRFADAGGAASSWSATLQRIAHAPLEEGWIPGERAGYHPSSSWFVLGEVVQRLTGQSFERAVTELILEPLEMADTSFALNARQEEALGERLGTMMVTARGKPEPLERESQEGRALVSPGASARGPIQELARFYEMLLGHGQTDKMRLISQQTAEAISARHRTAMYDETFRHTMDWGLGFIINSAFYGEETVPYGYGRYASRRTFGHSGSQSSCAFCDPQRSLVVAWVCNGMPGEPAHQKRQRNINNAIYEDLRLT